MQGIERARNFYFHSVREMLERDFAPQADRIAAGIAGRGSECYGFDDEVSQDHDFQTGLMLWITPEDDRNFGFELSRAYNRLVKDFHCEKRSVLGYSEYGVCVIDEFFERHLGCPGVPRCWQEWLYTPEYAFAEVLNGEVFSDKSGVFTGIRQRIASEMPADVRLKKLAARAVMMAQSGQYNFERCLKHNEPGAAALALAEFVRHTVSMVFLLNYRFAPYYKWQFRAMRQLAWGADIAGDLENLLTGSFVAAHKTELIRSICVKIAAELAAQKLSAAQDEYLEPHAFELMSRITNQEIRTLHIMEG